MADPYLDHNRGDLRRPDPDPPESPVLDANGDPVPGLPSGDIPEQVQRLFYGGRVPARECPHYIASSEDQAGFTECEGCSGKQ